MTNKMFEQHNENEDFSEDVEQNPGMRSAEVNSNPKKSLEEARNANEGKAPNAAGSTSSSTAEDCVPGRSDPDASDLPSAK